MELQNIKCATFVIINNHSHSFGVFARNLGFSTGTDEEVWKEKKAAKIHHLCCFFIFPSLIVP